MAIVSLLAGLVFLTISVSQTPHTQTLVNSTVTVPWNVTSVNYTVSASYFLSGNSNGKMSGSLLSFQQCCVDFYIFANTAWSNWVANGLNATNSTNSPVFTVSSSAIDSRSASPATFTYIPNPSAIYELVFFNANRTFWYTNSSSAFHVIARIILSYSVAPGKFLIYPGAALIIIAAALIVIRIRYTA